MLKKFILKQRKIFLSLKKEDRKRLNMRLIKKCVQIDHRFLAFLFAWLFFERTDLINSVEYFWDLYGIFNFLFENS